MSKCNCEAGLMKPTTYEYDQNYFFARFIATLFRKQSTSLPSISSGVTTNGVKYRCCAWQSRIYFRFLRCS